MSRRLLGYVVKLPSGEWHDGKSYADKDFDGYPWTKDAKKRRVFAEYQDACRYVLTYVPQNRLRIVPVYSRPQPAPAEGAAEGRYAVLVDQEGAPHFVNFDLDLTMHVSDRDAMEYERDRVMVGRKATDAPVKLVRVLDDGAHEAAVEAARREGAETALRGLRERYEEICEAHRRSDEGHMHDVFAAAIEVLDEAAKGQAQ